jgi:hypothetical protein
MVLELTSNFEKNPINSISIGQFFKTANAFKDLFQQNMRVLVDQSVNPPLAQFQKSLLYLLIH